MDLDTAMCDELLGTTRAVRKRLDLTRDVPRELIHECIKLAVQAPTGSNSQGWRWVIVDDPELRKELGELYRQGGERYLEHALAVTPEGQTKRVFASAQYLLDHIAEVPIHVIPCCAGSPPSGLAGAAYFGSIFPAVWSFQLALRARGLGSCLTTFHLSSVAKANELLNIPENVTQVALLPVAWTIGTDFKRAQRPPIASITHWNRWQD